MIDEETYWVCPVKGCGSVAFEDQFRHLGCAEHGELVRQVRQFKNGQMIAKFTEHPPTPVTPTKRK